MPHRALLLLLALLAVGPGCRRERAGQIRSEAQACASVRRDCDGRADNGCEARLGTDEHCGACGQRCGPDERCAGASCQPVGDLVMSDGHTCVLDPPGRVRCWGSNQHGELGDGTRLLRERPVRVVGLDDAVQIVARTRQTCARRRAGPVVCWGEAFGASHADPVQLAPTEVDALRGAADLALASDVFCGLIPARGVVCLPSSPRSKVLPTAGAPPGPAVDAIDIVATAGQLCAAVRDGSVVCWDLRPFEEIPSEQRSGQVQGLSGALGLVAGQDTVCALREGGRPSCWGGGIVTTSGGIRDAMVGGVHDLGSVGGVSDLALLGWPHQEDCAARLDGSVVCWAPPHIEKSDISLPRQVKATTLTLPPAYRVEATRADSAHCALTRSGEVYCWGGTSLGRLGVGRAPEQPSPREIDGARGVTGVVASDHRACGRAGAAGALRCWGGGQEPHAAQVAGLDRLLSGRCASIRGELACFDEPFARPLPPSGLRDVVQLAPAEQGSHLLAYFALHRDGTVHHARWKRANQAGPASWSLESVASVRGLSGVKELMTASNATCTRENATELRCWHGLTDPPGQAAGEVAVDAFRVTLPESFEQVRLSRVLRSGFHEGCGLRAGKVACWSGDRPPRWTALSEVRSLDLSPGGMPCALVASGALHCWSEGPSALTGHGSLAPPREPAPVLTGVAGWSFAQRSHGAGDAVYAWTRDGRLMAWGHNGAGAESGQLGWIAPTRLEQPTRVEGPGG